MAKAATPFSLAGIILVAANLVLAVSAATTHTVGDNTGWTIPSNSSFYSAWASTQVFSVGDTLVFNFLNGLHNVIEVPRASFDSCSMANQIGNSTTSPASFTITTAGMHYYICGFPGHCLAGLRLAITVTVSAATTHTVGDDTGWTIPSNSSFYSAWASTQVFSVGDTLVFNFTNGAHNVIEVPRASFDSCSMANQIGNSTTSPARFTITTAGMHYYICGFPGHCLAGQRQAITVTASSSPASPPTATAPAPGAGSTVVGNCLGQLPAVAETAGQFLELRWQIMICHDFP